MIINLLITGGLFVLFGYLEKMLALGWAVSALLLLLTLYRSRSIFSRQGLVMVGLFTLQLSLANKSLPILQHLAFTEDYFQFYDKQRLAGAVFLAMVWMFLRTESMWSDVHVDFSPHESSVRQFLLEHDPSLLYKVDSLLIKYKGREKVLMQKLRKKYLKDPADASSTPVPSLETQQQEREAQRRRREEEVERQRVEQLELEERDREQRHHANIQYQLRLEQERMRDEQLVQEQEQMRIVEQILDSDSDSDDSSSVGCFSETVAGQDDPGNDEADGQHAGPFSSYSSSLASGRGGYSGGSSGYYDDSYGDHYQDDVAERERLREEARARSRELLSRQRAAISHSHRY
mmetsp:Transcript_3018/g.5404  ORF Transcript_3018/g.5404 Transcript_3018/m.5404 type:complete len:347 (-) Transcript_3018:163-1203(-)